MNERSPQQRDRLDNEILFSKTVKAGRRIYYIDVKRDRNGELYLSLTESKRVKDGTEMFQPVFEKHKIFLYREDIEKFQAAFNEVVAFAQQTVPNNHRHHFSNDWSGPVGDDYDLEFLGADEEDDAQTNSHRNGDYSINIEF